MKALGDRMKYYEKVDQVIANPSLPLIIRLNGRSFSTWTKGLEKPSDTKLESIMIEVTKLLVEESSAIMGYTQSDEITLILHNKPNQQFFFGGKYAKINSSLASFATYHFNKLSDKAYTDRKPAFFDCRTFTVPNIEEAANAILWRYRDAIKNSIALLASKYYSHKQLHKVDSAGKLQMILDAGDDWSKWHDHFRAGTFVNRRKVFSSFTADELSALPAKHKARRNPNLLVERTELLTEYPDYDNMPMNEKTLYILGD